MTKFNKCSPPWVQKHHYNLREMLCSCSGRSLITLPGFSRKKKSFSWLTTTWNRHPMTNAPFHFVDFLSAAFKYVSSSHLISHLQPPHPAQRRCSRESTESYRITKWLFSGFAFQSIHVYSTGVKLKTYKNEIALFLLFFFVANVYFAIKGGRYTRE